MAQLRINEFSYNNASKISTELTINCTYRPVVLRVHGPIRWADRLCAWVWLSHAINAAPFGCVNDRTARSIATHISNKMATISLDDSDKLITA